MQNQVMPSQPPAEHSGDFAAPWLRRGLLWLAGLTCAGLAVELAVERHWTQPVQFVAWAALALVLVALALASRTPSRTRLRLARALAGLIMLSALWGVWEHIYANYDAGPLDREYGERWDTLADPTRWWLALSKAVGPSPPLAPGALGQAGFCVLLATLRHPAFDKRLG